MKISRVIIQKMSLNTARDNVLVATTLFCLLILAIPPPTADTVHLSTDLRKGELSPAGLPTYMKYKEALLVPVRNQGQCASCWSFAVVDMMADTLNLRSGGAWKGQLLSTQYLLDCSEHSGCDIGGAPEEVYDIPQTTVSGVPLESALPYTEEQGQCTAAAMSAGGLRIRTVPGTALDLCVDPDSVPFYQRSRVIAENVRNMKRALLKYGPIVGTVLVYEDLYDYDAKAVYTVTPGSPVVGWHAVEIVGWCDENVNWKEPGFDCAYWVVRSSYGVHFAVPPGVEFGFFYIKMGCNEAKVESRASVCSIEVPEYLQHAVETTDPFDCYYESYSAYVSDPERNNFVEAVEAAHGR